MMPCARPEGPNVVRITRLIRAPVTRVFAWCTDYSEFDHQIIGSEGSQTRKIISRSRRRIVFVDTYADSAIKPRKVEVSLFPPKEWRARFTGGRWEGTGVYRLSGTPEGTRLDIVFRMEKTIEGYTARDLGQRANEVWDKYIAELEKTLGSTR